MRFKTIIIIPPLTFKDFESKIKSRFKIKSKFFKVFKTLKIFKIFIILSTFIKSYKVTKKISRYIT